MNTTEIQPVPAEDTHAHKLRRTTWLAGTRGEVLLLGGAFKALKRPIRHDYIGWLMHTGEQGMATYQALDLLGVIPDESAPLCHPADEPAVRLNLMLERAEGFVRQRKGTHVVFSGTGPTAVGAAIYCHARGCQGLWLRPPDPAKLIPRLRWEAGLERLIRACAPSVDIWQVPAVPDWLGELGLEPTALDAEQNPLESEIEGLRPGAPLVLVSVLRRDWGMMDDTTSQLAHAEAAWAEALPEVDFLVISNLNARLEGPLRSLKTRPANLLQSAPLPYPVYRRLLERARLMLTDSPLIAAECLERGLPISSLGDLNPDDDGVAWNSLNLPLMPGDLASEAWLDHIKDILETEPSRIDNPPSAGEAKNVPAGEPDRVPVLEQIRAAVQRWLDNGSAKDS